MTERFDREQFFNAFSVAMSRFYKAYKNVPIEIEIVRSQPWDEKIIITGKDRLTRATVRTETLDTSDMKLFANSREISDAKFLAKFSEILSVMSVLHFHLSLENYDSVFRSSFTVGRNTDDIDFGFLDYIDFDSPDDCRAALCYLSIFAELKHGERSFSFSPEEIMNRLKSFPAGTLGEPPYRNEKQCLSIMFLTLSGLPGRFVFTPSLTETDLNRLSVLFLFLDDSNDEDIFHVNDKKRIWHMVSDRTSQEYEKYIESMSLHQGEPYLLTELAERMSKGDIIEKILPFVSHTKHIEQEDIETLRRLLPGISFLGDYDFFLESAMKSFSNMLTTVRKAYPMTHAEQRLETSRSETKMKQIGKAQLLVSNELENIISLDSWTSQYQKRSSIFTALNGLRIQMADEYLTQHPMELDRVALFFDFFEFPDTYVPKNKSLIKTFLKIALLLEKQTRESTVRIISDSVEYLRKNPTEDPLTVPEWETAAKFFGDDPDILYEWVHKAAKGEASCTETTVPCQID